jgi:hypothetical protein
VHPDDVVHHMVADLLRSSEEERVLVSLPKFLVSLLSVLLTRLTPPFCSFDANRGCVVTAAELCNVNDR